MGGNLLVYCTYNPTNSDKVSSNQERFNKFNKKEDKIKPITDHGTEVQVNIKGDVIVQTVIRVGLTKIGSIISKLERKPKNLYILCQNC